VRLIVLFVATSITTQLLLLFLAFAQGLRFLFWPLVPGIYSMRWLPNDPRTGGSFIVFPSAAQLVVAFAVNTAVYAGLFLALQRFRKH
jgi:hypothetical protein